ncbi:2-oxoglutarate-dependent dioxygenase ecdK-like [Pecten maximus]|uniref:2-oxoglutarate-dependent dioxygenase ecdK-like n=1 Tax=Pecten maximus TaxID=6579 RepID=UPI0014582500|nr:2-oxoglutarate-dependent dioxygenase ecdK-like [Pecten maximus]
MTMMAGIPVVDMSPYRIDTVREDEVDMETLHSVGNSICAAFRDLGFCYIKNHGIQKSLIDSMFATSKTFFEMPLEYKKKYRREPHVNSLYGWIPREAESLNPERPGDYKEAYNYTPWDGDEVLPDLDGFEETMKNFRVSCETLSLRILDLMSLGLDLEDKQFLRKCHAYFGQRGNSSVLKTIFYPALPQNTDIKPNQLRCGEHSDYGSLTLLFQDDAGGLEVRDLNGKYIPATPIPDTVLINIGDLMQRWTADRLTATKHRVVIPKEELRKMMNRQSIAFFIQPDDEVMIRSLDKSDKFEPIQSLQYLLDRLGLARKLRQSTAFFILPDEEAMIKCLDNSNKHDPVSSKDMTLSLVRT